MARPTTTRLGNAAPGFAPETRQAPSLGVFAPLNVDAAPSKAEQLAHALGVANDIAQPQLQEKLKRDEALGAADAANNSIDDKRREEDWIYDRGVKHVVAEKRVISALQEYQQHYEENFDKTQGEAELAQDFDNFAKEQLGDLINDPEMARVVANRALPFMQKITDEHRRMLSNEFVTDAVDTMRASIAFDAGNQAATIDYEEHVQRLTSLLGSRSKANELVINSIIDSAVSNGDETIIDRFVTKEGRGGVNVRATYAEALLKGEQAAKAERLRRGALAKEVRLADMTKGWTDQIDSGRRLSWRQILPHVQNEDMSREEALSWYNKDMDAGLGKMTLVDDMGLLAQGVRWQLKTGDLDPFGDSFTQERFQKAFDGLVQSAPEEQQLAVALKYSHMHSLPATKFKTQLNQIIATDDALASNLQLYTSMNDMSPDLMHLYVDKDMSGQYEAMLGMQRAGMKPEQIREEMKNRDPQFARDQWERRGRDVTKAVESVTLPTPGGWFGVGAGTDLVDVGNGDYIRKRIHDQARVLIEHGVAGEPAAIAEQASKQVYDSHVSVNLGTGRKVMVERWPGAPEDLADFVDYVRTKWITDNEKALGIDPEDGPLSLSIPTNADNARQIEIRQGGYSTGNVYSFEGLYQAYTQAVRTDRWSAAQAAAERRAKNRAEADQLRRQADEAFRKTPPKSPRLM